MMRSVLKHLLHLLIRERVEPRTRVGKIGGLIKNKVFFHAST